MPFYIKLLIYLVLRLKYKNTNLSLQKVWVIYLCGFKNVDIIQLEKMIQNNAFYIYALTCPELRSLWNYSVLLGCEIFWEIFGDC